MEALGIKVTFSGFHGKYLYLLNYLSTPSLPLYFLKKHYSSASIFIIMNMVSFTNEYVSLQFMK